MPVTGVGSSCAWRATLKVELGARPADMQSPPPVPMPALPGPGGGLGRVPELRFSPGLPGGQAELREELRSLSAEIAELRQAIAELREELGTLRR